VARWRRDAGPDWPERLTRFREWEWSEDEILEAAEDYARRHAEVNGLAEPQPPDAWERHMTPLFAYSFFRMKWAKEHGRELDLVDAMITNRLRRQGRPFSEESEREDSNED
jgi:hypothetical protein